MIARFLPYLVLLRPVHWVKNFFVVAPLLFARQLSVPLAIEASKAFALFCLAASAVYVLNDILDRKTDLAHDVKRHRPIANGSIRVRTAGAIALGLSVAALLGAAALGTPMLIVISAYLLLNIAYSAILKHVVIIDLFAIAASYVLRIIGGTIVIHEHITAWTVMLGTLLALFLAIGKRRSERVALAERARDHRPILEEYNPYFLDQLAAVITPSIMMTWILYTLDAGVSSRLQTAWMPLTVPFVAYGIFRYLFLVHRKRGGESPTRTLLTDRPLLLTVGLWCASILFIRSL